MDRRYYGIKALIAVVAVCAAILSGLFGQPRTANSMALVHYGASISIQTALSQSAWKASRTIGDFIRRQITL